MKIKTIKKIVSGFALFLALALLLFFLPLQGAARLDNGGFPALVAVAEDATQYPAGDSAEGTDLAMGSTYSILKDQTEKFHNITASGDCSLTIEAGGTLNVTGSMTVEGDLTIEGGGALNVNGNITVAGTLTLTQITLTMAGTGSTVTVEGASITLEAATVQHVGFLGFDNGTSGDKTLSINALAGSSTTLVDVGNVGADQTLAIVALSSSNITGESYSYQITTDYTLAFYGVNKEQHTESDWLTAYRTTKTVAADKSSTSAFVGVHKNGAFVASEASATLSLPEYSVEGYTNVGWGTSDTDTVGIKELSVDQIGTTKLYTIQTAKKVFIEFDRGYTPDQYTNDDYESMTKEFTAESVVGAEFSNPTMWRFGYAFAGWEITSGEDHRLLKVDDLSSYKLAVSDMTDNEDDTYTLTLKAVWTAEKLTKVAFKLEIPSGADNLDSIRIKCACETCEKNGMMTPADFAAAHDGVSYANNTFTFTQQAEYGMTLAEYFQAAGVSEFSVLDETNAVQFKAWRHTGSFVQASADSTFTLTLGENGLFGKTLPSNTTLNTYFSTLQTTQQTFVTIYATNTETLLLSNKTVWNRGSVWSVWVNDVDKTSEIADTSSILGEVPIGASVSFRMADASTHYNAAFSLWKLTANGERLSVEESVEGGYRIYTFTMPDSQVQADFSGGTTSANEKVMFNMKESPVSEQKIGTVYGVWTNELIENLTPRYDRIGDLGYASNSELDSVVLANGWSNGEVYTSGDWSDGTMTYFYELSLNLYYYLTTNDANINQTLTIEEGNGTHNQWRGGHRTKIYLKDCHLWATDYYTKNATLQEQITVAEEREHELADNLDKMANLYFYFIDEANTDDGYYHQCFVGNNNIIGCIGTEKWGQKSVASTNDSTTEIRIGSRITNSYETATNKYYAGQWVPPAGSFYPYAHTTYKDNFGYWTFSACYDHAWGNCNIYLPHKMLSAGQAYNLTSDGFIHVRTISLLEFKKGTLILEDDVTDNFGFNSVKAETTVVVRGDLIKTGKDFAVSGSLIVLGDTLRVGKLTVGKNATLIANDIEVQALNVNGSILANRIRNYSVAVGTQAASNGDSGYTSKNPTYVLNSNNEKIAYRFLSGNVYLLGYAADAADNPLKKYAELPELTKENGYPVLLSLEDFSAALDDFKAGFNEDATGMYASSGNKGEECLALGNSANDNRRFLFNGANIYSAGRITLNNGATISSGEIYASALSSKWDLFITGGRVEAEEIGNSAAVLITKADGTQRYAKTEITGGDIKADRIGALSTSTADDNRSALVELSPASLAPYTDEGVTLVHDALVYYSYNTSEFTAENADNFTIRITAIYNSDINELAKQTWTTEAGTFAAIDTVQGGGDVRWSLSSTEGIFVTNYDENGNLYDGDEFVAFIAGRDNVALYAIEVKLVSLSVFQDNGAILSITVTVDGQDGQDVTIDENGKVSIMSGSTVTVQIEEGMEDKVLLLYRENNIPHNLFPTVENGIVTFSMPFREGELHVTSSFTLDVTKHDISLPASETPGFRTEATAENDDRAFNYAGDIRITGVGTTYNIWLDDNFDNREWAGRLILSGVNTYLRPIGQMNAVMYVDGSATFSNVYGNNTRLKVNGTLILQGLNASDSFSCSAYCFGGQIESLSFVDLNMSVNSVVFPQGEGWVNEVNFTRCTITGSNSAIIHNVSDENSVANFNDCKITLGSGASVANGTLTLNMTNCTVTGRQGEFFKGNMTLDNTVFETTVAPTTAQLNKEAVELTNVTLKNGSVYNYAIALMATNVTVTGGSKLYVGYDPETGEGLGRCAASNITVEGNSELRAKYVICAGYTWSSSPGGHPNDGSNQQGIIVKDGGMIYASEFIGGDANGKVTVLDGGYIESKKIGVYGGYFQLWTLSENYPLIFSQSTRETSSVTISGGGVATVLAGGYLGGGKSTVSIESGGTVNLQEGSYLGGENTTVTVTSGTVSGVGASTFAASDDTAVSGDIIGKTVALSGEDLAVYVNSIEADSLTITGATNKAFDNAYGSGIDHTQVAVFVAERLQAKKITVSDGSVIYAKLISVYVESGEEGSFTIAEGDGSAVYTGSFGVTGTGTAKTTYIVEGANQNIWGLPITKIIYDLNVPEGDDDPIVIAPTVTYYSLGDSNGQLTLEIPSRGDCYIFKGWYDLDTGEIVDGFSTNAVDDEKRVRAIWEAVVVEFTVMVTVDSSGIDSTYFGLEADYAQSNGLGTRNGDSFYFTTKVTVPYKGMLYGENGAFSFTDYQFSTYTFSGLTWKDGKVISLGSDTFVDQEMVTMYLDNPTGTYLVLTNADSKALELTFYLNQTNGKPTTAQFTIETSNSITVHDTYTTVFVNAGMSFADAIKGVNIDDVNAIAKAVGYTLTGWRSTSNGGVMLDTATTVDPAFTRTWYAVWTPIEYTVTYNAATYGETAGVYYIKDGTPDLGEVTATKQTAPIEYDEQLQPPTVWKEGAQFQGWFYLVDGTRYDVATNATFCQESLAGLVNFENVVLYADYRYNKIEYNLNGGMWTNSSDKDSVTIDSLEYVLAGYFDRNGAIHSTTAGDYTANGNKYNTDDYRHTLQRIGYTFTGWLWNGAKVYAPARFEDMDLYADWLGNTYNVILSPYLAGVSDKSGVSFVKTDAESHKPVSEGGAPTSETIQLTVGAHIDASKLPDRNTWGTMYGNETVAARLLWGFTYVPLDPLYSTHENYGTYINNLTTLYNVGQMFVGNEVFTLPSEEVYKSALGEDAYNTYKDYVNFGDLPAGYELTLYATYREFAMMFVQYYLDADGNPTEVVLKTVPFMNVSEFTDTQLATPTENDYKEIEGYQLVGWYVNSNTVDGTAKYVAANMRKSEIFDAYKAEAKELGTYDIVIYGIFAANTSLTWTLNANTDASNPDGWDFFQFVIPKNMQSGTLTYTIAKISEGLHIIDLETLQSQLYKTHLNDGNTSNNTIALILEVTHTNNNVETHEITAADGSTGITVSAGDTVRIYLYHSHVMTQTVTYGLDIHFGFVIGEEEIAGQALNLVDGSVVIKPSTYTVTFDADTDSITDPVISDGGSFTNGDTVTNKITLDQLWGNVTLPTIEGYTAVPWTVWDGNTSYTISMTDGVLKISGLPTDNGGKITLEALWNILQYQFTVTSDVTNKWNVSVGSDTTIVSGTTSTLDYRTEITFTPNGEQEAAFILFSYGGKTYRLDLSCMTKNGNGSYTWSMPAADTEANFKDWLDLYLEDGSIEIVNDGGVKYSYLDNQEVYWPGVFNIYMNKDKTATTSTGNTLTLGGDLSNAIINLGNLYIGVDNGIILSENANAVLTLDGSTVKLNNILLSNGAQLTVVGQSNTKLELSPSRGFAAIGNQKDGEGSNLTLTGGNVIVNELGDYYGTWFGGENAAAVTLDGVTLTQTVDTQGTGRKITDAAVVTILNSTIGTSSAPVSEPIYADDSLTIKSSTIYQSIGVPLGATAPIGTGAGGSIVIDENASVPSHIYSVYGRGGRSDALYTGSLRIHNVNSYVCIGNVLLLELANGDVTIDANQVEQGGVTRAHTSDYILLEELLVNGKPNVTVNGIGGSLTLNDSDFVLGTLTVAASVDVTALLQGNLTVDKVTIGAGGLLTVETDYTVTMADKALEGSLGTYVQEEGTLSGGTIGNKQMDITLDDVDVTATALYAKNLTLTDCKVNCTGNVGSFGVSEGITTVTLSGNTSITATTIGALGEKNTTFTEVVVNGENVVVRGTLVRDIYRIAYAGLKNGYTLANTSATVLRTEENYEGTAVVAAVGSVALDDPTVEEGKTDRFVTWYLKNGEEKIALIAEADIDPEKYTKEFGVFQAEGLIAANVQYATSVNGIPTVTVYAFYSISGTVSLKVDKVFEAFTDGSNTLTVASDRAWSALLTIEATREDGEDYAVTFSQALPVGTQLMLVWLDHGNQPMYYYYSVTTENVTSVLFSDFKALGTSDTLKLGKSEKESESFILVVDRISVAEEYTVGLGYKADAASSVEELYAVGLTVTAANEKVTIVEANDEITIEMPENELYEGDVYAILVEVYDEEGNAQDLPYMAEATITYTANNSEESVEGKLIGGDMILFVLGTYEVNMPMTFTISMSLPIGYTYKWSVVLLENEDQVNVLKTIPS